MSLINSLFQQAQLAEASYANLTGIAGLVGTQPFQDRLTASGMGNLRARLDILSQSDQSLFASSATASRHDRPRRHCTPPPAQESHGRYAPP